MGIHIAILFGYNGTSFEGLERAKGEKTVESVLLSALATLSGKSSATESVTMINISRAATTEEGEHAARQILSVEIVDDNTKIPSVDALNAVLPESIKVFKIISPTVGGFSARRSCEARTYEYLIPTYAFMTPQQETGFDIQAEVIATKDDLDNMYPDADPESDRSGQASLFTTLRRQLTRSRSRSRGRSSSVNAPVEEGGPVGSEYPADTTEQAGTNTGFFSSLSRKKSISRRSLSRKRSQADNDSTNSLIAPIANENPVDNTPQFFDPIALPHRSVDKIRAYRITEEQLDMVRTIVAIFRGTHNWHNYVPGADADDQRCFMRIINIESGSPEVHNGMEWIRIKAQSKAMARFQFRRMMALLILVVRTNTPRSLIANSFGVTKIDIPNAPAMGLIFHQPTYAQYNEAVGPESAINFDEDKSKVESFRRSMIHEQVYTEERDGLHFEEWLRKIDTNAFLYKYYLNARGLITPQNAFLREGALEESMYNVR
ncbi:pseudouridine synthase [Chytriomyces cf. hyalinus JEL632]|nr:pseudouridine synthase [Chytriomyces cf. hyalinus JEL632]